MNEILFKTADVVEFAEITPRQLQLWEECGIATASRQGRVRVYTKQQALFIVVIADFRRRGLSLQRLRNLLTPLKDLVNEYVLNHQKLAHAYLITDGRNIQFAVCPNKTLDLVLNLFRPLVCTDLVRSLDRIEKKRLLDR